MLGSNITPDFIFNTSVNYHIFTLWGPSSKLANNKLYPQPRLHIFYLTNFTPNQDYTYFICSKYNELGLATSYDNNYFEPAPYNL
jgi:hypothetical protein